jgi:taurine dioxygenase
MTMPISPSHPPVAALPWELAGAESRLSPAERPGRAIRGGPRRLRRLAGTQPDLPYERFGVAPLSPLIGAEITGVDLGAPLDPHLAAELHRAWLEWKVLFFRDQRITPAQQVAFAATWGDLERQRLSGEGTTGDGSTAQDGPGVARYVKDAANSGWENAWHVDMTGRPEPAKAFVLRLVRGPAAGGDTIFADAAAAYDNLPVQVRIEIDDLRAVHDMTAAMGGFVPAEQLVRIQADFPPVVHPVVRTHPETGRRTLFVNSVFTTRIVGMEPEPGEQLLQYLFRQLQAPEYQVRFRWTPDAVAFWDNRAVQHYAVSDYFPAERVTERVAIAGDRPY